MEAIRSLFLATNNIQSQHPKHMKTKILAEGSKIINGKHTLKYTPADQCKQNLTKGIPKSISRFNILTGPSELKGNGLSECSLSPATSPLPPSIHHLALKILSDLRFWLIPLFNAPSFLYHPTSKPCSAQKKKYAHDTYFKKPVYNVKASRTTMNGITDFHLASFKSY